MESVKKEGIDVLMVGSSIRFQESSRKITGNRTIGEHCTTHNIGSI